MPQAFRPSTVLAIKLFWLVLLLVLALGIAIARWRMEPANKQGDPVMQPIRFSHKHHVGDDGIDCRYCHTAVEKSSVAGLPSTRICLSCHAQLFRDSPELAPLHESARTGKPIAWNRVHDLPDFVYFDHSIHVGKGVACIECHGRVDQMPVMSRNASLDMQWCMACHRNPTQHIRPLAEVTLMTDAKPLSPQEVEQLDRLYRLQGTRRLTDCSTCHR